MKELQKQDLTGLRKASEVPTRYNLGQTKTLVQRVNTIENKVVIDTSLSTTSGNAVANSVITKALNNKQGIEDGKGLSTNDYTTEEKEKLAGISEGAEKNVVYELIQTNELLTLLADTVITNKQELEFTSSYIVGNNSLEIYWNRAKLIKDIDYAEVGNTGESSNSILLYRTEDETLTEDTYVEVIVRKLEEGG